MTPARLRTYLAVVDSGSARAAAEALTVTESAVSAALAALQRELGVALVVRDGRGLRVTEPGLVFAGYARRILGLMDEGVAAAREGVRPEAGRVRVGAVPTAGEYLVPGLLAGFRQRYPHAELTVQVAVRDRVFAQLGDHQLDVVIAGRPPAGRGFRTAATRPNSLVVVGGETRSVPLEERTWLLREAGSGTRATTLALLDALSIGPPTLTLGSHGAVVASAMLGLGVTLVSADSVAGQLRRGELHELEADGTPLSRPWHAVTSGAPTPTARLFLRHLSSPEQAGELAFRRR